MTRRAIERRFFISKKALSKFTRDIAGAPLLVWFTGIQLPTVPTLLRSEFKERGTSPLSPCLFVSSRLKCISFLFFLHQCYQQYKAQLHVHGAGEKRHFWQTPCLEGTEAASAICRVVEEASARRTKSTSTGLGGRLVRSSGVGTPGSVWLRRP